MAAYAALVSLTHIIHDIEAHPFPPISIDNQQLQSLTEILTFFQEFLQGYSSSAAGIDEADSLEIRIAQAAYAAEDVIESHIVGVIKFDRETDDPREESNCINLYEDLQQVIEEMNLIKKQVMEMVFDQRPQRRTDVVSASRCSSTGQNTTMVCPDDGVLHGIMAKLDAMPLDRRVIPIVGMAGIGKTTLAKYIYAQPFIKKHFDVCAWATINQQHNIRLILSQLLSQREEKNDDDGTLGLQLHKHLFGRRYLIVLDNMWGIDAWDEIQRFFPDNKNSSRILVTTRLLQLSSQLNSEYSHQMEFLDEVSSWGLFSKIVFGEESFPLELVEAGKKIVENCRGLPLSIVVMGGLLKKMEHTQECWESIKSNVATLVNLDNDKHCLRLLKMSYNDLPVYLKPCFLFMGVFEEDRAIRVSRILKLWVSEGFLTPMNGKRSETIGKEFLKDLVDRNLILTDELGSTGNIKSYKIHDLLRDLCLRESQKYEFYYVIRQCSPQILTSQRRVVIGQSISSKKFFDTLQCTSHTRSIICENRRAPRCAKFGLLRTLEAYKMFSNQSYVNALVSECVNLRHLVVGVNSMSSFLSSINLLWNLQTLIVYSLVECNAPVALWNMPQIRHIEFNRESLCVPDPPSEDVAVMENLEVLKGVKNFKCGEEGVKRIPNVRKLEIRYSDDVDADADDGCLSNIESLSKLESLDVSCDKEFRGVVVHLNKLTFPHFLKNLNLRVASEFEWEEILEKIGWLPLFEKLKLMHGCFGTGKWEIGEAQFPSLKYLHLRLCGGLEKWMAQESSMPRLEQIHLIELKQLEEIPSEIGYIPTLQIIKLVLCHESAIRCAKSIEMEQIELQGDHLPFRVAVRILRRREALRELASHNFEVKVC